MITGLHAIIYSNDAEADLVANQPCHPSALGKA